MVIAAGFVPPGSLDGIRRRAERFLAWIIDPEGAPANFADTTTVPLSTAYGRQPSALRSIAERFVEPSLVHAVTAGRFGSTPGHPIAVFDQAGIAVMKAPWPSRSGDAASTHLALSLATTDAVPGPVITWHDRGLRLLVEPGPAPVDPNQPAAAIASQPHSHNTVVIQPPPPTRPAGRFGHWGSHRNRLHLAAQTRSETTEHSRIIVLDPGRWLLVVDQVDAPADSDIALRFHIGDELDLMMAGDAFTLLSGPRPVAWAVPLIGGTPVVPERGRTEPVPNGWWSPDGIRMVPNWAFGWDARGSTTFATVISLDGRPAPVRTDDSFAWHTDAYRVRVAVTDQRVVDVVVEPSTDEEV